MWIKGYEERKQYTEVKAVSGSIQIRPPETAILICG